ncbi:hypothetical protein GE061_013129 [Apolygus lucorum]|uniref:SWIM-type domain-containing protein n=1 Tax=Apolygus lucorum TaxID=248454 RepID=A0A8S9XUI4_APOLU|nr:hypothetical protein GE061_013129 [Apolygus lucorum]
MNFAYVEDYNSDVSCSPEDDLQPKPKKARRADREWHKIREFQSSEKSLCTCPYFSKHLTCKLVLGMQIRLKLVEPPPESKNVSMGQKRKRGRPSKDKAARLI